MGKKKKNNGNFIYRDYTYLNYKKLNDFAAQTGIKKTVEVEVTETESTSHNGEASAGVKYLSAKGGKTKHREQQKTYKLTTDERAEASAIIQKLISKFDVLQNCDFQENENAGLTVGRFIELQGYALPTEASAIGEIMSLLGPHISEIELPEQLAEMGKDQKLITQVGIKAFIANELPNIHLLYHFDPSDIPNGNLMDVFINFEPGFFIDKETPVDLEQEITILGHVKMLVPGKRYKSTDAWIMPGFNRKFRNQLLATSDTKDLAKKLAVLNEDVYEMDDPASIDGPAMIIDVAAMY